MNKKNIIIIISILVFIMIVGGVSYSYFVYNKNVGSISISTGEISIDFSNTNGNQTLTNVIPLTDNEGMSSSDYFDFTVNATVDTERIYYEVYILPDSENTLDTSYLKTYLTDQANVEIKGVRLFNGLSSSEVENGKVIYKGIIETNNGATRTETKNFRLRLWLDENYSELISKTFDFDIYLYAKNVDDNFTIPSFRNTIASKVSETYVASYDDIIEANPTFTTQDQVSTSAPKQTVYYYTGSDAAANANVLFAGYCWQIIRTTDNGGVRMIYNGVAVNNKCETTRTVTKGINGQDGTVQTMAAASLYGRSYDYDLNTGTFTIEDSTGLPTSWSTSDNNSNGTEDYKELIGTYTCLSNSNTCTTLYYVGSINRDNTAEAYVAKYTINNASRYNFVGMSPFNPIFKKTSLSMTGYMFNKEYYFDWGVKSGEYYSNISWNGTTYVLSSGNAGSNPDLTHRYICDVDCTKVRYYYNELPYSISGIRSYYVLLENGKTINDMLKETLNYKVNANDSDENINVYNSSIKGFLENWYKKSITPYSSYIDSSVTYCNNRSINSLGGWNPNSNDLESYLEFKSYNSNSNLDCENITDRFSVTNSKAKISYPVGLISESEHNLMTSNFANAGYSYWTLSPSNYQHYYAHIVGTDPFGGTSFFPNDLAYGVRPAITLNPGTEIDGGTGTYTDPYVVGPIVTRTD